MRLQRHANLSKAGARVDDRAEQAHLAFERLVDAGEIDLRRLVHREAGEIALGNLAAQGHHSQVQGTLLQVWWDFGARRLQMQVNLGPAAVDVEAPPPGAEELMDLGGNGPASLAGWGGRWSWLPTQG